MFNHSQPREPVQLIPGVHMVAGPDLTDPRDCLSYLVAGPEARVLIDCGAGPSAAAILDLALEAAGAPPTHLLLTHAHIDHAGGAAELKRRTGCRVLIHHRDAPILASGDPAASAASWYGLALEPLEPDAVLEGGESIDLGGGLNLQILATPGHTPGSLSAWLDSEGQRVLFAQDVHGPFSPLFGSDLRLWRASMEGLLALKADILAEGHYGIFRPADEVEGFLRSQLDQPR